MYRGRVCAVVAACLFGPAIANAQSSVSIFGLMDNGVTYVSNEHGKSLVKANDGVFTPNLWGFQGTEDLGGGTRAIFKLTDQFSVNTGANTPGQSIFSKTAYVGLADDRLGTVTMGIQYDYMAMALWARGIDTADDGGFFLGFPAGP
ncbi:MAG TPA: porin, partial [Pararobbsia sp.]|nr:porin [Pararobbsia sp.]